MDYFKILNLTREPFSNAPDPELFYKTNQHNSCLQQLEIAIRLKRGLNVVIGEVGTGKTTLCRHLIRSLSQDPDIKCNLLLDPGYKSPLYFLKALQEQLCPQEQDGGEESELSLKEQIKSYLFDQVAVNGKTDLLIIDEGQKIPQDCMEILRELLNFESNSEKLLQIIIFAQPEFKDTLRAMHNVTDRINLLYELQALSFRDTQNLILHRIDKSKIEQKKSIKFTIPALWSIYKSTRGYPRKIINLCHKIILILVMQQKFKVNWFLVQKCNKELLKQGKIQPAINRTRYLRPVYYAFVSFVVLLGVIFILQRTNTISFNMDFMKNLLSSRDVTELGIVHNNANHSQKQISRKINKKTENSRSPSFQKNNTLGTEFNNTAADLATVTKSPDETADKQESNATSITKLPSVLGTIKVKDEENLWKLAEKIYGIDKPRIINQIILKRMIEKNPQIDNRNMIRAQSRLRVPVVMIANNIIDKGYRLLFTETQELSTAYSMLDETTNDNSTQLLSTWTPERGLKFYILGSKIYENRAQAEEALVSFPGELRNQIELFDPDKEDFGKHTYFLSRIKNK